MAPTLVVWVGTIAERRRSLKTMFPNEARSAELKESSGICDYIVRKTNIAVHLLPVYNRTD